jgi:hypothetical protein
VTRSNEKVAVWAAVLVIAVLAGVGFVQVLTEAKTMERETKVTIEVTATSARALEVRVTNETPTPITVFRHSLPWSSAYSALLVAVKTDAVGTVLDRSRPVDDPVVGTLTIQPKQTVNGEIDLDRRFPGLSDGLRERDVIVFWSHQLQTVDGDLLPRTGGWVLLPKQG